MTLLTQHSTTLTASPPSEVSLYLISRHGRVLSPAAMELLRQIVSDTEADGEAFKRARREET